MLGQTVKDWIIKAPTYDLQLKLIEYQTDLQNMSPRDVETRSQLRGVIQSELARREVL